MVPHTRQGDLLDGVSVVVGEAGSYHLARNQPRDRLQNAARWNGPPGDRLCSEQVAQRSLLAPSQHKCGHDASQRQDAVNSG
jgi:hypothetical protein